MARGFRGVVMLRAFGVFAVVGVLFGGVVWASPARIGADYGIYCLQGRLVVDRRDLEVLKNQYRADVCRLDLDPCASGILEKLQRMGGAGASCTCK